MTHPDLNRAVDFSPERPGGKEGFYLHDLAVGAVLQIETAHRNYLLVKRADTHMRISGHPTFCPEPVEAEVEGSITNGPTLLPQPGFIGRGMCLIFKHPRFGWVTTSQIREIHRLG